jgi:hypothetical protein
MAPENEESRPASGFPKQHTDGLRIHAGADGMPLMEGSDTALLLDVIVTVVRRFVVMSEPQAVAVALWIAHSHVLDACEASPYLAITSAEKRSGKTRLLDVLELLVARPWRVVIPSEAVVFRKIDAVPPPTFLLDEVDAIFNPKNGNVEGLRALLNAGNRPGTKVPRCVGPSKDKLKDFSVFCPKAIAGIRDLPDTVADRSIPIRLKRRTPNEPVERFRRREAAEAAEPLHQALVSWAGHHVDRLTEARPDLPDELDDRAQEAWEPLLSIADLAKGGWPQQARSAAIALSGSETRDDSAGVRLLADMRAIFASRDTDRISSAALVADLHEIEEAPWGEWYGKPITTHGVAKLLSHFDIRPRTVRSDDGTTAKGYRLDQLEEAFTRYLPVTNRHTVTNQQPCGFAATPETSHVTDEKSPDPAWINGCDGVTVSNAGEGDTGDEEAFLRKVAELVDEGVLVPASRNGSNPIPLDGGWDCPCGAVVSRFESVCPFCGHNQFESSDCDNRHGGESDAGAATERLPGL